MALEQQGLNAEAEQAWAAVVKADRQNAEALAHIGLLEARQQHLAAAVDFYRRAVAINPELPGLQLNLGLTLFKAAQFPDAIKSFSSEIKKHPGDQRLTILLGMAHFGMADYLVAIPYLQRATERDAQDLTLRMTLAHSCMWSKQYQCVLDVHKEIVALNADSAEADMLAGEAFDAMRNPAEAAKEFKTAILANPKAPNAHFGLGYLLWTQGEWTEAAKEFQLELENDPQHILARAYLADSGVRQNEIAKALPELERLVAIDPSDPLVRLDLGVAYAATGRGENAIQEIGKAIESGPEDKDTYLRIARLYESMGRKTEARAEFDRAGGIPQDGRATLQQMIDTPPTPDR